MGCTGKLIPETAAELVSDYISDDVLENMKRSLCKDGVVKVIKPSDVVDFKRSEAFYEVLAYINKTSEAIQMMTEHDLSNISPTILDIKKIFDKLNSLVRQFPPNEQDTYPHRDGREHVGNCVFRDWYKRMQIDIYPMIDALIPAEKSDHIDELATYLGDSFGSPRGSIYGTGHELSFLFFMCSLFRLEVLKQDQLAAAALSVFSRYLAFVRRLQDIYDMVPAGTQNAYSIDDFQFMPYLWGVAQLCVDPPFAPANMLEQSYIDQFAEDYMLMGAIKHITKLKKGDFATHSPLLWTACTVCSWSKLYKNLLNMYLTEVVTSFSLLQNAKFGRLMPFTAVIPGTERSKPLVGQLAPLYIASEESEDEEDAPLENLHDKHGLQSAVSMMYRPKKKTKLCPLLAKTEAMTKQLKISQSTLDLDASSSGLSYPEEPLLSVAEMMVYRPSVTSLKSKQEQPAAVYMQKDKTSELLQNLDQDGSLGEMESSSG